MKTKLFKSGAEQSQWFTDSSPWLREWIKKVVMERATKGQEQQKSFGEIDSPDAVTDAAVEELLLDVIEKSDNRILWSLVFGEEETGFIGGFVQKTGRLPNNSDRVKVFASRWDENPLPVHRTGDTLRWELTRLVNRIDITTIGPLMATREGVTPERSLVH